MAASYIPTGYRLLTADDNGKEIGVDLEPIFYIDNTVTPNIPSSYSGFYPSYGYITHPSYAYTDLESMSIRNSYISVYDKDMDNTVTLYSSSSWSSSIDFTQPFTITSWSETYSNTLGISYSSNNFIYVKDIDPYNIILTKPKLTVKCANATMEKNLVVQLDDSFVVPTGTLEITENGTHDVSTYANANVNVAGGGGGVNFTLYSFGYEMDVTYTLDGTNWVSVPSAGNSVNLYGQAILVKMYSSGLKGYVNANKQLFYYYKSPYRYYCCIPEENETLEVEQVID